MSRLHSSSAAVAPVTDANAYAVRIRNLRTARGLTQEGLATLVGVAFSTVNRWEMGRARPSAAAWQALLRLEAEASTADAPDESAVPTGNAATAPSPSVAALPQPVLPVPFSSFVGRGRELAALRDLLGRARLLTLTGTGGCGKTRLALALVRQHADGFPDGVWFVDLASLTDPVLVPGAVAAVLGVREQAGRTLTETLAATLTEQRALLLLDNCEHLLDACARLVQALLQSCPHLHVLATSRELIGLTGETVFTVPPLALPPEHAPADVRLIDDSEAAQLFIERARARAPGFALSAPQQHSLAQICRRLDGLPLALELAAARVGSLSVVEIAARLDDRFRLLRGSDRTASARHQTLHATIDWSYDLLDATEQTLFRRLGVFAGSFDLAAAAHVVAGGADILDLLARLVDKSLVTVSGQDDGETRYRLLETLRAYARERLGETAEREAALERHAAHFLAEAQRAAPHLKQSNSERWQRRLAGMLDDLRATLAWLLERGEAERALTLATALGEFWRPRGAFGEGRRWLRLGLQAEGRASLRVRAAALRLGALFAREQGDLDEATGMASDALQLHRELDDEAAQREVGTVLAMVSLDRGDYAAAREQFEQLLTLAVRANDRSHICTLQLNLGVASLVLSDFEAAKAWTEAGRDTARTLGVALSIIQAEANLGAVAHRTNDLVEARSRYESAIQLADAHGYPAVAALTMDRLSHVARLESRSDEAWALLAQSLRMRLDQGARAGVAEGLTSAAILAADCGDFETAATLIGSGDALFHQLGGIVITMYREDAARTRVLARDALRPPEFERRATEGAGLPLEAAIALVAARAANVRITGPSRSTAGDAPVPGTVGRPTSTLALEPAGLPAPVAVTPRERQVLRLLATGRSNREIATELVVSVRTVERHIENLYAKTRTHGRAAIIDFAHRTGLL